jgi:hypothetical protein
MSGHMFFADRYFGFSYCATALSSQADATNIASLASCWSTPASGCADQRVAMPRRQAKRLGTLKPGRFHQRADGVPPWVIAQQRAGQKSASKSNSIRAGAAGASTTSLFSAAHFVLLYDRELADSMRRRVGWAPPNNHEGRISSNRNRSLQSFNERTLPYFPHSGLARKAVASRLAVRVVIRPYELSKHATMKAALQFLHEAGIVVHGSFFADADVALLLRQQDAPKAAAALAEAGFKAMAQTSRQSE